MSAGRITRRPRAAEDLFEQASYIADGSPAAADHFLAEAEAAFRQLATMPELGSPRDFADPALTGLRMWPVPNFRKHLIFYLPQPGGIEVVRVLHTARDVLNLFGRAGIEESGE
jgi:toxin ParE1/3/4